jgi:hypothetical protein
MIKSGSATRTAAVLFLAIFTLYLALSPNTTGGRGYISEEIDSGMKMLEVFNAWVKGRFIPPMVWSRHGPVPVFFDLPFIKLGKFVVSPDYIMSMSPIFFSAATLAILFLWLRKLTSPGLSLLITLAGAFSTLFWPYAYIGLETKQSFFVLLAGYVGLADGKVRSWSRLIVLAVASALAMSMKSTGIILWPAFAYLVLVQFQGEWKTRLRQVIGVLAVMGGIYLAGAYGRRFYWGPMGGGYNALSAWLVDSPLQFFMNVIGLFGSPSKGLFVFAPVLLLTLYAIPRAVRGHREVSVFALLVTGSISALVGALVSPADEVWGPRYMHVAIAPLLLTIGAVWSRFEWKRHAVMLGLFGVGVVISFLGAFYYYGARPGAMLDGGHNTMEWINGDMSWSEVTFNAREFGNWLGHCPSVEWTPRHVWVWEPPPGAQPWKAIDLKRYCQPQATILRGLREPLNEIDTKLARVNFAAFVIGLLSLSSVIWGTVKRRRVFVDKPLGKELRL